MTREDRQKPGATLIEYHTMETSATLEDFREWTRHYKYVYDVDGFLFKRYVREDGAPTRWERLRSPSVRQTMEDTLAKVERSLESARSRADRGVVTIAVDNREQA